MKILCLGTNTEETDYLTQQSCDSECHGLLSEIDKCIDAVDYQRQGWYHSSVYDIDLGKLQTIAMDFDQVIMLDQPIDRWSHPDAFYKTVKLVQSLGSKGVFQNPSFTDGINFFEKLVEENPSFCIFPFVELLVNYDYTTVCCRSLTPVTKIQEFVDFKSDKNYSQIRKKMLAGELIPEHCSFCYRQEALGLPSARQQETVEWTNRLGIKNLQQLEDIESPAYYEIRASNKCNLQCRMCQPENSHLIDKEYRKIGLIPVDSPKPSKYITGFEIIKSKDIRKIYISGGEPTVISEFYDFLDDCITKKETDYEILVNTNGTNLSQKFKAQLKHFSNFQFVFSIDGLEGLNHYIRWPSDWSDIVSNWKYLVKHGHKITVNTTISIYNAARLYELFEFIDNNFPSTIVHIQCAEGKLSPFRFPDYSAVLDQLHKIKKLSCYKNDSLFSQTVDGLITLFNQSHGTDDLQDFFQFNDLLDRTRCVKLEDFVPELATYRSR